MAFFVKMQLSDRLKRHEEAKPKVGIDNNYLKESN